MTDKGKPGLFHGEISNFIGSNIFGPMEFFVDMESSSHWGLIIAPGQEANLGKRFRSIK